MLLTKWTKQILTEQFILTQKKITPWHYMELSTKLTTNINLNGEKHQAIPLKLGTTQSFSHSTYLFNIALEILATAITQLREIKGIHI
jgi:hypothetical protein